MTAWLMQAEGLVLDVPDMAAPRLFGPRPSLRLLNGIDFAIAPGETVGIVGESGSGKTTLGRTLLRLLEPSAGRIIFAGRDITHASAAALKPLRRRMQMIFQDPRSAFNPRRAIGASLAAPLRFHGFEAGRDIVADLMRQVGLEPKLGTRYPHELSGGQRQRAGIARAIALKPDFILADEIVSGLDTSTQAQVLALLKELTGKLGLALAFIGHDLSVIRHICSRVYIMRAGEVVEAGPTERIFAAPRSAFTRQLISAIPLPVPDPNWLTGTSSGDEVAAKAETRERGMEIKGAVALVSGANRGVGRCFVEALAARGAKKVYLGTRKLSAVKGWTIAGCELVPVRLDVTKPEEVKAAARLARDVRLLVNNAGINQVARVVEASKRNAAEREMATNYFGLLGMARAFAPVIAKNGGGAMVNMLSILAHVNLPAMGSYAASKAAAYSASQGMRAEFAARNIHVLCVLPGVMDTDMMKDYPPPKMPPAEAVAEMLDALEAGEWEVYPGDMAKGMVRGLKADALGLQKQMMQYL